MTQYEPFDMPGCKHPLWLVRDEDHGTLIDLRSLTEALCMSWPHRWAMYFIGRREKLGLQRAHDRLMRETFLVAPGKMKMVLVDLYAHLDTYHAAMKRVSVLHGAWSAEWSRVMGAAPVNAGALASGVVRRSVTPELVREIYRQFKDRRDRREIAKSMGVSKSTVSLVVTGGYANFDQETFVAWQQTFGALALPRERALGRNAPSADLVRRVHTLHQQKFKPKYIGECLGTSASTVSGIISGAYKFTEPTAMAAWQETFGSDLAAATPANGFTAPFRARDDETLVQGLPAAHRPF